MCKGAVVCINNGILLSHKREWNIAICSNMDEMRCFHTEWSKSGEKIFYGTIYIWNLKKKKMTLFTAQVQTHWQRKQTYDYQIGMSGKRDKLGVSDLWIHTTIYKIHKPSVCLLWRNVYLVLWPIFWLGRLFFWSWAVGVACIVLRLVVCQLLHLLLFSPILKAVFSPC